MKCEDIKRNHWYTDGEGMYFFFQVVTLSGVAYLAFQDRDGEIVPFYSPEYPPDPGLESFAGWCQREVSGADVATLMCLWRALSLELASALSGLMDAMVDGEVTEAELGDD